MMPKKKQEANPEDQAKRFEAEVQRLIDAGELNPIEADERFERTLEQIARKRSAPE
jgi:hypothetical protein